MSDTEDREAFRERERTRLNGGLKDIPLVAAAYGVQPLLFLAVFRDGTATNARSRTRLTGLGKGLIHGSRLLTEYIRLE